MSKDHEYSRIEKVISEKAKDAFFSIPNILDIKNSTKKIQFISFLAEWCPNCDYEAIELKDYINIYNSMVDFSTVMLFSSLSKSNQFISKYAFNSKFIDSECNVKDEVLNKRTSFFRFRELLGDDRKWGVPLHMIRIINLNEEELFIIKGESKKLEVQNFLNENLKQS